MNRMWLRTEPCVTPQEWTKGTDNEELIFTDEDILDTNEWVKLNQLITWPLIPISRRWNEIIWRLRESKSHDKSNRTR